MEQITERIAGVSLPTVLLILVFLTAMRGALHASRIALLRATGEVMESVILAIGIVFLILRPFVVQSYFIPSGSMHPTLWEGDHILVNKWAYRTCSPQRGDVIVFRAPHEASPDEKEFIKRIVGIPGDVIEVQEGFVEVGRDRFTRTEIRERLGETLSVDQWAAEEESLPPLRLTTDALWLGDRRITPQDFAIAAGRPGHAVRVHPGRVLRNGTMLMESYVAEDAQYHLAPCRVPPGQLFVMGDNRNLSHDSHIWGMLPADRLIGRADLVFWPVSHAKRIGCGN
ncbi:MAG: signal peptidase I [Cytophagales bacterium]|nr:signal peptidase I [Armatimonadota bacterium]